MNGIYVLRRVLAKGAAALLSALLCISFAAAQASADRQPLAFEDYAQLVAGFVDGQWETEGAQCIRMLEIEQDVTVRVCLDGEYVAALTVEYPLGQVRDCVILTLESLGWLTEEEVNAAFRQESQDVCDVGNFRICRIEGKLREGVSICREEDAGKMVWQPVHGGEKLHNKPRCSGMDVPCWLTEEAADAIGWANCGKCRKNG